MFFEQVWICRIEGLVLLMNIRFIGRGWGKMDTELGILIIIDTI
jgi:hypothetical protein